MAGQDYPKRLEAGGVQNMNIPGDFIFCKFASQPFTIIMDGKRTEMEAGDKIREGNFRQFEIENSDPLSPLVIVLNIGEGDFDRQIIKGEVMIEPGLRKADGSFVPDTRFDLKIDLVPSNLQLKTYVENDLIASADTTNEIAVFWGPDNTICTINALAGNGLDVEFRDPDTLAILYTEYYQAGSYAGDDNFCYWPGVGIVGHENNTTPHGIYLLKADGSNPKLFNLVTGPTVRDGVKAIAYDPFSDCLVAYCDAINNEYSGSRQYEIDGNQIGHISAPNTYGSVSVDPQNGDYVYGNADLVKVWKDGVQTGVYLHTGIQYNNGIAAKGNISYGQSSTQIRKVALRNFTTKPEIRSIKNGCGLVTALTPAKEIPQILADITATIQVGGVKIEGEIIRAAIEYHFGAAAPDDYLDHVYRFDMTRNGAGQTFKPINTGNRTFAKANITDNFSTIFPGQIVLTVDNELTLGAYL